MSLIWKLLRQHISVPQFAGFALANLFGMFVVLLGFQFYHDVMPVFTSDDSFMKSNYLILSKKTGAGSTFSGRSSTFSGAETDELSRQPFVGGIGKFVSTEYKVDVRMSIAGQPLFSSELFFESVPDQFVDVPSKDWHFRPGQKTVPIILPRTYIAIYNFGFAQSRNLPKMSEGLAGMIDVDILVQGNGQRETLKGRVIGFSGRLSTVVVPEDFILWSNERFAPGQHSDPTRLILQSDNPAAENVTQYLQRKGYEVEDNQLQAEKTTYFLRLMVTLVMIVGLVISVLSFYILMLSIYLLVEKNSSKLENLLLIGYSPNLVARPYQLLTIGLNGCVLLVTWVALYFLRQYYMGIIETLFPQLGPGSMLPALALGLTLFVLVSLCNVIAVRQKIVNIWKRKE